MTYLIVGLDRRTLAPWHRNVMADDASGARRIGCGRAALEGVELVVAAVIGPGSDVLPVPASVGRPGVDAPLPPDREADVAVQLGGVLVRALDPEGRRGRAA